MDRGRAGVRHGSSAWRRDDRGGAALAAAGKPEGAIAAYVVSIALSIPTPLRRALRSIAARSLDINVLMVIAAVGAVILGDWIEAAAVVWLFGIAQWLESYSMARARRAIRSLMTIAPPVAFVRRARVEQMLPVTEVVVGDVVIVRPGERVPVDGRVVAGESAVDQAPVTGESWPAEKVPGDEVFAGSINGTGAIEIEASRPASDSTIARIVRMVEEAQSRRAPVQTFVDRFARRYTPAVVLFAIAIAIGGAHHGRCGRLGSGEFATWVIARCALLVVACPCARDLDACVDRLALTAAAQSGVLIKGGAHLEARLDPRRGVRQDRHAHARAR